ncbi:hypothetical protein Mapa_014300 [Marchantia paleacea]|nr:hypothetical protein Mapa_014300 [Marchantia paleacea]
MTKVAQIALGSAGMRVSALGLGCMGMSAFYGPPKPDGEMIELVHKAVELGVTMLDTSDVYGDHTNEILLGKALKGIREKVQIATKFGFQWGKPGVRGDAEYVRSACEASLKSLDVDYIDLYYQHRVDNKVPIEVTMGALKELVEEGKIKYVGLSEASAADIRRAHAVHPVTAVQLEYSLWCRDAEKDIIPTCQELGIGIVAYSPLGNGFFAGLKVNELAEGDARSTRIAKFADGNYEKNKVFLDRLCEMSAEKKCTSGQLALAWVQHKGVIAIPGTTKMKNLEENIDSLGIHLSPEAVREIETAVPHEQFQGERASQIYFSPPLDTWTGVRQD